MKIKYEEKEPLAIEGDDEKDTSYLQLEGGSDDDEFVDAEEEPPDEGDDEVNKILDQLDLPNYNDVEMRLAEPEMTATKQRNYLQKVLNDADKTRRQAVAIHKSNATIKALICRKNIFRAKKVNKE